MKCFCTCLYTLGLRLQETLYPQVSDIDSKRMLVAAHQALTQVAANPRYLGSGRLGMTGVLHTWGRDLNYHPHLHFVVPGGALSEDGKEWLSSRVDFLLLIKAVSKLFRANFRDLMREEGLLEQSPT